MSYTKKHKALVKEAKAELAGLIEKHGVKSTASKDDVMVLDVREFDDGIMSVLPYEDKILEISVDTLYLNYDDSTSIDRIRATDLFLIVDHYKNL